MGTLVGRRNQRINVEHKNTNCRKLLSKIFFAFRRNSIPAPDALVPLMACSTGASHTFAVNGHIKFFMNVKPPATLAVPPDSEQYQAMLAGAGAMWTEMQTLLHYNVTLLDQPALRKLVIHENILGKATFSNRQQVWAKMKRRYRLNQHDPVFHYFLESYSTDTSTSQRGLLGYLLLCASDALVQRISQDWLVPRLLRPGSLLRTEEVETYLITLSKERPAIAKWTTDTRLHISQHYLGAVRDFGLAEGKAIKRTLSPQVGSQVLVYAIKLGMLQELKPVEILQSVWFRLLGIELDEAISRMYQLNAEGLIKFRMVGNIAELALVVKEEV